MVSAGPNDTTGLPQRRARALAWGLWLLVVLLIVAALWCAAYGADGRGESIGYILYIAALIAIPYPTIGALVIARQPGNAVG